MPGRVGRLEPHIEAPQPRYVLEDLLRLPVERAAVVLRVAQGQGAVVARIDLPDLDIRLAAAQVERVDGEPVHPTMGPSTFHRAAIDVPPCRPDTLMRGASTFPCLCKFNKPRPLSPTYRFHGMFPTQMLALSQPSHRNVVVNGLAKLSNIVCRTGCLDAQLCFLSR